MVENSNGVKWDVSLLLLVMGTQTLANINGSDMAEPSRTQESDTHKVPKTVDSCVDPAIT